jgi:hypothetical protein
MTGTYSNHNQNMTPDRDNSCDPQAEQAQAAETELAEAELYALADGIKMTGTYYNHKQNVAPELSANQVTDHRNQCGIEDCPVS